jgi:hemolysin III
MVRAPIGAIRLYRAIFVRQSHALDGAAMTIAEQAGRNYSRAEHRVDLAIHIVGALFAVNASAWLLAHVSGSAVLVASVSVYCAGLLAMIFASAAYNLWPDGPAKRIMRRIDHAAIFIMIAATYTPFAANRLGGLAGPAILSAIWFCASAGIALKTCFPDRFETLSLALYLGMGWMIVTVIEPLSVSLAVVDFRLLLAGGVVYSAGVAFYVIERIPFHKAIWHGFVLVAAVLHFSAVALEFSR